MTELKEVKTKKELKEFVLFAYKHYKNNKNWIPPLIKGEIASLQAETNPSFEGVDSILYIAYKDGKAVGRVAGLVNNRFVERWEKKYAHFGWMEFIDDLEVSGTLLKAVEDWAAKKGMESVIGPKGPTTFDKQGMLVEGFDEMPTFAGVYNYDYYARHLEHHGYGKETDYVEYEVKVPEKIPEKLSRIRDLVMGRYEVRLLKGESVKELMPYGREVFEIVNEAYKPLFGFVKLSPRQIEFFMKKHLSFVRPEYVALVQDEKGKVLGFQISIPSLSKAFQKAKGKLWPIGFFHLMRAFRKPERLDLILTGVLPEYQNMGLNAVFMTDLTQVAIDKGIVYAETNQELEENVKIQNFWRYFDHRMHRRSRIFLKKI